jgi:RNA polymerase sigma-70 factor (ECF subfamily)
MNNDETLWKGIMLGDKEMFLSLYKKYYHSLLFIGLKEIKDSELVKDTIQQQFLYLWEKRATITQAKNVKSYLITSFLRRLSHDWKKSAGTCKLEVVNNNYFKDPTPTPEENLLQKDGQFYLSENIMNHIKALPRRQKELIILKFYEGFTYEEIVQKTGLTHRTVYNKIHEALQKLKTEMDSKKTSYRAAIFTLAFLFIASLVVTLISYTLPVAYLLRMQIIGFRSFF